MSLPDLDRVLDDLEQVDRRRAASVRGVAAAAAGRRDGALLPDASVAPAVEVDSTASEAVVVAAGSSAAAAAVGPVLPSRQRPPFRSACAPSSTSSPLALVAPCFSSFDIAIPHGSSCHNTRRRHPGYAAVSPSEVSPRSRQDRGRRL